MAEQTSQIQCPTCRTVNFVSRVESGCHHCGGNLTPGATVSNREQEADSSEILVRAREIADERGTTSGAWEAARREVGRPSAAETVTEQDLIDRTRAIMAETGVPWKKAWPEARSELGPVELSSDRRQRRGCLLGGLRVSFLIIVGFVTYLVSVFVLAAIPPIERFMSGPDGFIVAVPAMLVGVLVALVVARRFQEIPVVLMAGIVLVVGGVLVGFSVYQVASGPSEESIANAARYEELRLELDRAVSLVAVPTGWEVQYAGGYSNTQSVGYTLSPDLSSSGTRMHMWVADYSEDAFWKELDETLEAEPGAGLVDAPRTTSMSGVPGYLFEISGLEGDKTGQPLGAYWAVFFGPEYTYVVAMVFELHDQDDMSQLWRNTLTQLTLVEDTNTI